MGVQLRWLVVVVGATPGGKTVGAGWAGGGLAVWLAGTTGRVTGRPWLVTSKVSIKCWSSDFGKKSANLTLGAAEASYFRDYQ